MEFYHTSRDPGSKRFLRRKLRKERRGANLKEAIIHKPSKQLTLRSKRKRKRTNFSEWRLI